MHLFGILLVCAKQQSLLVDAGITLAEVRAELQQGLELLQVVGSRSLMSQKGAACLLTFLDVFDSFSVYQYIPGFFHSADTVSKLQSS